MRPSSIGPADQQLQPGFEVRASSPITVIVFSFLRTALSNPVAYWSSLSKKRGLNVLDEIPVDHVVNGIIAHAAYGIRGIVHSSPSSAPMTAEHFTCLRHGARSLRSRATQSTQSSARPPGFLSRFLRLDLRRYKDGGAVGKNIPGGEEGIQCGS
ncbi:hypothetical protein BC938DRAFT_472026 [Jimgerdemannia flammicorona]|uniref:Uncharacterized protein n=1 Tax=Jimgerdemannia flammicorona TaxID=994334 RepID=A0A433Q6W3_9FUNG|nr:hypothetical protein BC938DRAFT_472026 [Jimgerdemannia flammicorona]